MSRYSFVLFIIIAFSSQGAYCQIGQVSRAVKFLEKGDFEKVEKLLSRADAKDSASAAIFYGRALLFIDSAYQHYHLDSAHVNALAGQARYALLDTDTKKKYDKIPLSDVELASLLVRIRHIGFARATMLNSEDGYNAFLEQFPGSDFGQEAVKRRDSLAFQSALNTNTYQAYADFMKKYPDAREWEMAKARYEKLFFEKSTSDGRLASYVSFLKRHPETVYRKDAERAIFHISTADGKPSSFRSFLNKFPKSDFASKAKRLLQYLEPGIIIHSDSMKRAMDLSKKGVLYPSFEVDGYVFFDHQGVRILSLPERSLSPAQLCEGIANDFIVAGSGIYGRNGLTIYEGTADEVADLGSGVLKISSAGGIALHHKSGWPIDHLQYEDARLLHDRFLAVKRNGRWGLMALNGYKLLHPSFDDILALGPFILLQKSGLIDVTNDDGIARLADKDDGDFKPFYAEYQLLGQQHIWLQTAVGETVLNADLKEVVSYGPQEITGIPNGYIAITPHEFNVYSSTFEALASVSGQVQHKNDVFAHYKITKHGLFHLSALRDYSDYDSARLLGKSFAIGYKQDSLHVHFSGSHLSFHRTDVEEINLVGAQNVRQYVKLKLRRQPATYYNHIGVRVLQGDFDEVLPAGFDYLIVAKKANRGLYDSIGNLLLNPAYTAIAGYSNGTISYLKDRSFGLVNVRTGTIIPPAYDRNIWQYSDSLYVGVLKGEAVFINHEGEQLKHPPVEDIVRWTDSVAIVKKDFHYYFVPAGEGFELREGYKSYRHINCCAGEQYTIVRGDEGYGVFTTSKGLIIPASFNDVINIGTDEPFFFTEKHVEEAEFYVVIYYDRAGTLVYKRAYEASDYGKVLCEN